MNELQCPYCSDRTDVPEECYSPGTHYECECENCGKTFGFTLDYSIEYSEYEVPCANGEPHDWLEIKGLRGTRLEGKMRCSTCDREISKEEHQKLTTKTTE